MATHITRQNAVRVLGLAGLAAIGLAVAAPAHAERWHDHHRWHHDHVGVWVNGYAPPPTYYAAPPVYAPPPVVYGPPAIGLNFRIGR